MSTVLLKNDNDLLPISPKPSTPLKILLVGPDATDGCYSGGQGSGGVVTNATVGRHTIAISVAFVLRIMLTSSFLRVHRSALFKRSTQWRKLPGLDQAQTPQPALPVIACRARLLGQATFRCTPPIPLTTAAPSVPHQIAAVRLLSSPTRSATSRLAPLARAMCELVVL